MLRKELYLLLDKIDMKNVRLPISPSFQCESINVEECGYFNSLTKPIKILISGRKTNYGIIFKVVFFKIYIYSIKFLRSEMI